MEQQLEEIREQQKASWNKFSPGWKKWDELTMAFLKPMGDEMIRLIKPKNNDVILDVAGGTGEPGLTIASMVKGGKVFITDISDGMLKLQRKMQKNEELKTLKQMSAMFLNYRLMTTHSMRLAVAKDLCFFPICYWPQKK